MRESRETDGRTAAGRWNGPCDGSLESLLSKASERFLFFSWRRREAKIRRRKLHSEVRWKVDIHIYCFVPPASVFGVGPPACDLPAAASLCVDVFVPDAESDTPSSSLQGSAGAAAADWNFFFVCLSLTHPNPPAPPPHSRTLGIHPDYTANKRRSVFFFLPGRLQLRPFLSRSLSLSSFLT